MALSAKAVARAAALVSATVGAVALAAPPAHASGIGPIFLYRHNAGIHRNCPGHNQFIKNEGDVKIKRDIYAYGAIHSSIHGLIQTIWRREYSATKADKQLWCYKGSFYNEFFAANGFSRAAYKYYLCSPDLGECNVYLHTHYTPWKRL